MKDNLESVESVITGWILSHGKRIEFEARMQACIELFELLIAAGYEQEDIGTRVKTLALARMVGHKSKFGKKGLDRWRAAAEQDYNDAYNTLFKPKSGKASVTEFAAEPTEEAQPVYVPKEEPVPKVEIPPARSQASDTDDQASEDWRAKFREGMTTTDVEDADTFMAKMGLK